MKISFFTASMHRYPLEKCFEVASEFGYDGIEIWGGRPMLWHRTCGPRIFRR